MSIKIQCPVNLIKMLVKHIHDIRVVIQLLKVMYNGDKLCCLYHYGHV